ncbi:NADP-dependent oxidoreductase [Streptomyces griseorubiginosus]|uniref:NADP-dependent oxidoreductase n=1 Tax=Streptomyces griseorubiginosus TaxID=67304 RepID=UPI001AD60C76|nr:NADP-dependent oxidoreductase [Streptomyces griseorubiginosus]MBO4255635.1 zinc-binding dehydrogenase [Streptomyces griseorubiginosus]
MRAAVVTDFGGPEAVQIVEREIPEPGAGQVRIKVAAAALNPADAITRSGVLPADPPMGFGWDAAGTIDATGADAGWAVGDAVVALEDNLVKQLGTHAEYVIVEGSAVAAAPTSVDAVHAATVPLNTLTAAQALDLLDLKPGQTLLVTGAAGAVGGYAVQLAAHQGIEVTALAGENDADFVRGLGAARFVARGDAPGRHDAVLDAALLGETALEWVRDGGAYAGVMPPLLPAPVREIRTAAVTVTADGARLKELVALVDAGVLTTRVAETYPLNDAPKAHARLAQGGIRGRLVLLP